MAATQYTFYNEFKKWLGDGTVDLDNDDFRMALFQSASNFATVTLTTLASITNEVANGNGYITGGKTMAGITWAVGASASEYRFDATSVIWTASGGTIPNIKGAVIYDDTVVGDKPVCFTRLTTSQFTLTDTNTLTVTPSANGIFELN